MIPVACKYCGPEADVHRGFLKLQCRLEILDKRILAIWSAGTVLPYRAGSMSVAPRARSGRCTLRPEAWGPLRPSEVWGGKGSVADGHGFDDHAHCIMGRSACRIARAGSAEYRSSSTAPIQGSAACRTFERSDTGACWSDGGRRTASAISARTVYHVNCQDAAKVHTAIEVPGCPSVGTAPLPVQARPRDGVFAAPRYFSTLR